MTDRWTCARCSRENDPWVVGCAGCGTVRPDLSVAGSQTEQSAVDAPPPDTAAPYGSPTGAMPSYPPPADATATLPEATDVPPAGPAWPPAVDAQPAGAAAPVPPTPWNPEVGTEAPPAKVPLWKRLPLGWIVVGIFVFGGAIGGLIFNASRDSSGEITRAGDVAAADLRIGDCFDLKAPDAEELEDVTGVPCSSEHEYEMFFIGTMTDGTFPAETGFRDWVEVNCLPAFDAYVGKVFEDSQLDVFWLEPTSEAWNAGDRSIQCAVYDPAAPRLTESLKDAAR